MSEPVPPTAVAQPQVKLRLRYTFGRRYREGMQRLFPLPQAAHLVRSHYWEPADLAARTALAARLKAMRP